MAKVKIPKKVAGVKIPKKVRRKAKKAVKMVDSPAVRSFAAAAVTAAGESRAARSAEMKTVGEGTPGPERTTIRIDGEQLVETIRAAAVDGLRRFLEGLEEGLREVSERLDEAEGKSARKRARTARNEEVSARWREASGE